METTPERKKIPARFFLLDSGKPPVREWLNKQEKQDKNTIGKDIALVEYGWPVGMPTCKPMGDGLFEVRSDISEKRIARIIFCIEEGTMYLLHGFIKKSQETPKKDIDIARDRQKVIRRRLLSK